MKRTVKKRVQRKSAPESPTDVGLRSQLKKGRKFIKKYSSTFRALAK
jgi:hypothetical protein